MKKYTIKLNLARNCLRYIIKVYNIKEIFIPYYICPTVISAVRKENCNIKFYHIDDNFYPSVSFDRSSYILYPNYFGICADNVFRLCEQYPNLIVDNAHNFYMPDCGLASFSSLRKFFNVKNGACLNISQRLDSNFEYDNEYYEPFENLSYDEMVENENKLNIQGIKLMSQISEKYFSNTDLKYEKDKRIKTFYKFHERFKDKNKLKINLSEYDVPFIYPYLTEDDSQAEMLEKEGHLILRYWNFLPDNFPEYKFYRYLIPIPLKH